MKIRAYGADATLEACREMSYGVAPPPPYRSLDFKTMIRPVSSRSPTIRCSDAVATRRTPTAG